MSAVANESVILYNLIKRAPETQTFNDVTPNAAPKQTKKIKSTTQILYQKLLLHTNINNKIHVKQFAKCSA